MHLAMMGRAALTCSMLRKACSREDIQQFGTCGCRPIKRLCEQVVSCLLVHVISGTEIVAMTGADQPRSSGTLLLAANAVSEATVGNGDTGRHT